MKYKVGQIYFWNSNEDLFGKAITYYNKKTFGKSDCTHVGIISQVTADGKEVMIHEAGDKGFTSSWYPVTWLDEKITTGNVHIGQTKEPLKNVFEACEKYLNIGYGWLDIFAIFISMFTGFKFGLTGTNKLICSEAVSRIIYDCTKTVNIAEEFNIPYDEVTPMHIFNSKYVEILS